MDTSERNFEETIEAHLLASGYRQRESKAHYDKDLCLDSEMVIDFVRSTQAQTWKRLKEQHGEQVRQKFLKRVAKEVASRGTLDVLRKGVSDVGCLFHLAYFQPESGLNPEHQRLYKANIFSVIRQLHYSRKNENSIDMVCFLNGLPIFTTELKNPAKGQTVEDAVWQYRKNREPREPLLGFGRCLVHFAVDTDYVRMTTHLRRAATHFLPFDKGHDFGAGNPPNPNGFKTSYLWEDVWQTDNLLDLINHFIRVVDVLDDKGEKTGKKAMIFPRYHQLDAVRRMVSHAKENGTGHNYLVEHSAGSGKSNTIAWLGHQFAGLHDSKDKRVFDTVIVITDRRVLDRQLRETVQSFEQTKGLVSAIETKKSSTLADALAAGKDIITCTLQTFPFVTEKLTEIKGSRFAVIIDEAHSSSTGETARSMKQTLASTLEEAETEEAATTPDNEDEINQRITDLMAKTGRLPNVSFFAFTATPKQRTLELFGTPQADGTFLPFSLYSMRQAIEERFILDVLCNYTTFKSYFSLLKKIEDDPAYKKKKAVSLLKRYADLHRHGIRTKAEIIIEHFETQVKNRINGQAKAMIVTRSRLHAVRYKQMADKVLEATGAKYKAIVAFSGTVKDPESGAEYTESGMNGFPERQTAEQFKSNDYRFMIVAEKFQTGFDQPLLCAMYVDKILSGVNAVQTLSRLNRICPPHKKQEDVVVLDFANDVDDIKKAFQPYFQTTILSEATDPNILYDLKRQAEEVLIYSKNDLERFTNVYFSKAGTQEKVRAVLDPVVERFKSRDKEGREQFRACVDNYVRVYSFLSHVLRFKDAELEKTYQLLRLLRPLLPRERERLPLDVTEKIDMDSYRIQQTSTGEVCLVREDGPLEPISDVGTGGQGDDEMAPLSQIIGYVNENFGTDFTDEDKVRHFADDMERRLVQQQPLRNALNPEINPSEETRRMAFDEWFDETLEDMIDANTDLYKKIINDENFAGIFRLAMFKKVLGSLSRDSA